MHRGWERGCAGLHRPGPLGEIGELGGRQCGAEPASRRSGFAGIENELFHLDKTQMLFGDAKRVIAEVVGDRPAARSASGRLSLGTPHGTYEPERRMTRRWTVRLRALAPTCGATAERTLTP
jgi:hypothetical protein